MQMRPWLHSNQYHSRWNQQFVSVLVQPRYATLPNIMKAKKKPMEQLTPEVCSPDPVAVTCCFVLGQPPAPCRPLV